jgi:hypothetical protein
VLSIGTSCRGQQRVLREIAGVELRGQTPAHEPLGLPMKPRTLELGRAIGLRGGRIHASSIAEVRPLRTASCRRRGRFVSPRLILLLVVVPTMKPDIGRLFRSRTEIQIGLAGFCP